MEGITSPTADISQEQVRSLKDGVESQDPVVGNTHDFYRYPARFSPSFAAAALESFSKPGDLVFDPFMGGGTVLVEAIKLGRKAIGLDINSLAHFITEVKTQPIDKAEGEFLQIWLKATVRTISIRQRAVRPEEYIAAGYQRYLSTRDTWRIRKYLELFAQAILGLPTDKLQRFGRCIALKVGQWALDGRKQIPPLALFKRHLIEDGTRMIADSVTFGELVNTRCGLAQSDSSAFHCSALEMDQIEKLKNAKVDLILTSPPYPGVYVNYHRWKVRGRLETPAPFWIAGTLDGAGLSFYTLGSRHDKILTKYFNRIRITFEHAKRICKPGTVIIQLLGFTDVTKHLPLYLRAMEDAGYEEVQLAARNGTDGRIWRDVPGRRWYAAYQAATSETSKEVVLIHRLRQD